MNVKKLSGILRGRIVSELSMISDELVLEFSDASKLVISQTGRGVSVVLHEGLTAPSATGGSQPTARQREYLDFIRKYMARHGSSPAETDIQAHFLVSAPSAHQMVKTLERRGFIYRERDIFGNVVPRSIRVLID